MFEMTDLPRPGKRYQDEHGALVTITGIEENRVVFMRDGYPYPCMRPLNNFLNRFQKVSNRQSE
ncbi:MULTISPECIES: DUF4222 domain-containing protein [Yersinia]|uniref:DUF4222 domain-containing protein n=2 Tax=Yersinia TaxID=629 RepID=UPI0008FEB409|nr:MULTISPECIES: DUF4222 domain-containing protein [Yersinia]EKN4770612.1 DUF4222 domain-containing protein [Yersinia enterocolitica]EKN4774182.1 DUF4222 domain-containing protein [Yersinia enterocolitica]EKN4799072.1 DUF4222 domain-containing protein [Yersinia enterocolitica]EKN4848316.1 DUF4222 domain-containing protein [Yersinia enterocolitica]EKN5118906.1 DUF4222 domain-containing protein [Yersinia enterocolitica]